jgi:hypothetical protein
MNDAKEREIPNSNRSNSKELSSFKDQSQIAAPFEP